MLKFDDQFPIHRKVARLNDSAFRFHVEAIFWSRRHLTDGWIAQSDLGVVSRYRTASALVAACVDGELWHRVSGGAFVDRCEECESRYATELTGNGWIIHGYLDWQQSRSKVLQTREARKAAGHVGGVRSGQTRTGRKAPGHDPPKAKRKQDASARLQPRTNPEPLTPLRGARTAAADGGRAAGGGRKTTASRPPPMPEPANGAARDQHLAGVRATIAEARRKARPPDPSTPAASAERGAEPGPLERLRALTPDVPPLVEPSEQPDPHRTQP